MTKIEKIINIIQDENMGEVLVDAPMKDHTSFKTGGKVSAIYSPNSVSNLLKVIKFSKKNNIKFKVIGRGSNLLFPDRDIEMIVIKISHKFNYMEIQEDDKIKVQAGYSTQKLAKVLSKQGYKGLEFAGGIPGTIGGSVYMNAGAHTGEFKDIVEEVVFLDKNNELKTLKKDECNFSYRHSVFQENEGIILEVFLKMQKEDKAAVFKKMSGNLEYRKEMQPLEWPSFGSVFRNPQNNHAGKLIEEVGLKGHRIGGAQISTKHANFIINDGNAKTEDVKALIKLIKKTVKKEKNIDLHQEVEIYLDGLDG